MKKLILFSALALFSCEKENKVCTCHNETWKRESSNEWKFDSKGDNFKDFCANDRKQTQLISNVYLVQKCFE